jgi:DNA-binding transcriptional LysR family regulator
MIPSATDLAYFTEVAQTQNLSRAAERLGISQPSLSLAMQRLEQAAGAPLLVRSKRGVTLTHAGKQLHASSRQLLQNWEDVQSAAQAAITEVKGSYSIGVYVSVALYRLTALLPSLMKQYPELNITLHHDLSRKITEDVISMHTDIGIVVNPPQHSDLVIHKLCTDKVTLWRPEGKITPAQNIKSGEAVLICNPDLLQSQSLLKELRRRKINFARTIYSTNLIVIADLVAQGAGIGILPAQAAGRAARKLEAIPNAPAFEDDHCVAYRVENKGVKSIQVLTRAIRDAYAGA